MKITKSTLKKEYLQIIPYFKEEKTQTYTSLALTLIALTIFGFFAINPTISTIIQLKKQLKDDTVVDQKLSEKISNLTILQQKYSLLEKDLPLVTDALPEKPDGPIFIGKVQGLTQELNAKISRIQSSAVDLTKPRDNLTKFSSFTFSIEGESATQKDIVSFLSSLSNIDRLMTFDVLSINNKLDKEKNISNFSFSIRGKTYFKK